MNYTQILARVLNTPLLVAPEYMEVFLGALTSRAGIASLTTVGGEELSGEQLETMASLFSNGRRSRSADMYQVVNGIAVIDLAGTLVQKSSNLRPSSGMTGYNGIAARLNEAMNDPEVKGVLFDIDSPGGEVSGCFDLTDAIHSFRGRKPMHAFAGEQATSAAFAIGSAADKLYLPRTGVVGSVGVLTAHRDVSKRLAKDGIAITLIHAGAHKIDGNPFEALGKDVKADIQARINETWGLFTETVARNRGMSAEAVKATEARIYTGQAAVDIGFADGISTLDEVLQRMAKEGNEGGTSVSLKRGKDKDKLEGTDPANSTATTQENETLEASKPCDAATVISLCDAAGMKDAAMGIIKEKLNDDQVIERIDLTTKIQDVCKAAGVEDAGSIVAAIGNPVELVQAALLAHEDQGESNTNHSGEGEEPKGKGVNVTSIWTKRKLQGNKS